MVNWSESVTSDSSSVLEERPDWIRWSEPDLQDRWVVGSIVELDLQWNSDRGLLVLRDPVTGVERQTSLGLTGLRRLIGSADLSVGDMVRIKTTGVENIGRGRRMRTFVLQIGS